MTERHAKARDAYKKQDHAASAAVHTKKAIMDPPEEHGGSQNLYVGDMVYGGLDGVVTTFAVVSGVAGAALDSRIVLIMGLANLLGDGVSMAAGAYLSLKSEKEYYDRERKREGWEVEHFPDGERLELTKIYMAKGYSAEDAATLVRIHSKNNEQMVDAMMVVELGLMKDERIPILSALATFFSFVLVGMVPLLIYLADFMGSLEEGTLFPVAAALSGVALFAMGATKVLITKKNWLTSGMEMLVVGGIASSVAYLVGFFLSAL